MLESLIFSLNSTMPLFFLMLLGYLLHRRQFLTDDFVAMANKFVFHVALPVQLFRDLATMDVRASFDGPCSALRPPQQAFWSSGGWPGSF